MITANGDDDDHDDNDDIDYNDDDDDDDDVNDNDGDAGDDDEKEFCQKIDSLSIPALIALCQQQVCLSVSDIRNHRLDPMYNLVQ